MRNCIRIWRSWWGRSDLNCKKAAEAGLATFVLNYRTEDWAGTVAMHHNKDGSKGAHIVLDCVGGPYLGPNLECLAMDGRIVLIGLLGGLPWQFFWVF
jgi:NADPH:quinone reductase